jgi:signal peptidase II
VSEISPDIHPETADVVVATAPLPPEPGTASPSPAPVDASAPPPTDAGPERVVPGDRLGVPADATRVIGDYGRPRPSYVFLGAVALITLAADLTTKAWANTHLGSSAVAELVKNHLSLIRAENRGGAWGLLQSTSENVRRPFFLLVSVAAIAFIMTLYRRLQGHQRALKWGLPLVLGGALGNVFDRIRYGHVIDFIDYRADWMRTLNERLLHNSNDHWPTFNIADIAICVGVGLMAVDMFTSKRGVRPLLRAPLVPPAQSGETSVDWLGAPVHFDSAPPEPAAPVPPPADLPHVAPASAELPAPPEALPPAEASPPSEAAPVAAEVPPSAVVPPAGAPPTESK